MLRSNCWNEVICDLQLSSRCETVCLKLWMCSSCTSPCGSSLVFIGFCLDLVGNMEQCSPHLSESKQEVYSRKCIILDSISRFQRSGKFQVVSWLYPGCFPKQECFENLTNHSESVQWYFDGHQSTCICARCLNKDYSVKWTSIWILTPACSEYAVACLQHSLWSFRMTFWNQTNHMATQRMNSARIAPSLASALDLERSFSSPSQLHHNRAGLTWPLLHYCCELVQVCLCILHHISPSTAAGTAMLCSAWPHSWSGWHSCLWGRSPLRIQSCHVSLCGVVSILSIHLFPPGLLRPYSHYFEVFCLSPALTAKSQEQISTAQPRSGQPTSCSIPQSCLTGSYTWLNETVDLSVLMARTEI